MFQAAYVTFGQSNDSLKSKNAKEFEIKLGVIQSSFLAKNFYGINWNIKYFPSKRFGTEYV